jgi:hypothetical protein
VSKETYYVSKETYYVSKETRDQGDSAARRVEWPLEEDGLMTIMSAHKSAKKEGFYWVHQV